MSWVLHQTAAGRRRSGIGAAQSQGGGNPLDSNHTFAGYNWASVYDPANGTGTGDTAVLDGIKGVTSKWTDINGGAGLHDSCVSIAQSGGNNYKLVSWDGSDSGRMTNVDNRWPAPAVGQYLIHSFYIYLHFSSTMGQSHQMQFDQPGMTNYMQFTHFLYRTDRSGPSPGIQPGYHWYILQFPGLTYPSNRYCCPIPADTTMAVNLRWHRTGATTNDVDCRIYNTDGSLFADDSSFSNGADEALNVHNMETDNPTLAAIDDQSYRRMEFGNNGDGSALDTSNFLIGDNHMVTVTSDSTLWIGARQAA